MNTTARGTKRPRTSRDQESENSYYSANDPVAVKTEADSPYSQTTAHSRQTPARHAQTPEHYSIDAPTSHYPYPYPSEATPQSQTSYNLPYFTAGPSLPSTASPSQGLAQQAQRSTSPTAKGQSSTARSHTASSFRNVSACNRCRLRKNRCDQHLPACKSCEKAGVKCVSFDPFLGREVPRSYVYHLESRTAYLEKVLQEHGVKYLSTESFALDKRAEGEIPPPLAEPTHLQTGPATVGGHSSASTQYRESKDEPAGVQDLEQKKIDKLVSQISSTYVQGASDRRFLGTTSGISFARVVFAAVKSTMSRASSERGSRSAKNAGLGTPGAGSGSLRDSAFGLQTKPIFKQATFPDKELGLKLVNLYFEHTNPQIPILHRGEFMQLFERVYASSDYRKTPKEAYLLNIVFAIGAGIILDSSVQDRSSQKSDKTSQESKASKKERLASQQAQPEEYHASAIVHLESFLGSSSAADITDSPGGGLEELQAVLLLAGFALLRPVAPGLWYIAGVAMRLAIDLGLHYEDNDEQTSNDVSSQPNGQISKPGHGNTDLSESGRRQWERDLRRRLWWSTYSIDRLVSTAVGRPNGISDQVCTTEFPSHLDDKYISRSGFTEPPGPGPVPSAKVVAHHYFRLRLLQSEIVHVLQCRTANRARAAKTKPLNPFLYHTLPSPYIQKFSTFSQWRTDVDRRLWEWKESAPTQNDAGVQFSPLFFDLNYWQTVITLFQPSLSTPPALAHEVSPLDDGIPATRNAQDHEEDQDEFVYLKVAEAGQKVLKLYRQLHRVHLVNYTYLATHHLFMAGISFLYAIWHSVAVRSHLSLDDVDFTVLAATSVMTDLIEKCPPAEACKEAFDRMSRVCIQMCMSTTGFGHQAAQALVKIAMQTSTQQRQHRSIEALPQLPAQRPHSRDADVTYGSPTDSIAPSAPRFDMNLKDLFSDDETRSQILQRPSNAAGGHWLPQIMQQHQPLYRHEAVTGAMEYSNHDQPYAQVPQYDPNMQHMNIDPLLQQISPHGAPDLSAGSTSDVFVPPPSHQYPGYPIDGDFDTRFFDSFQLNHAAMEDGAVNLDMLGGADGGLDMFNGFFFGSGGVN